MHRVGRSGAGNDLQESWKNEMLKGKSGSKIKKDMNEKLTDC